MYRAERLFFDIISHVLSRNAHETKIKAFSSMPGTERADVHNTATATGLPPKNHQCFRRNHFLCTTLLLSIYAAPPAYADGASSAALAIEGISVTDGITRENMEATLDIFETDTPDEINLNNANMADAILDIRVDPDSTAGDTLNTIETSATGRPDPMRPGDEAIVDAAEAIMATGETHNKKLITLGDGGTCVPETVITASTTLKFCERATGSATTEACQRTKSIIPVRHDTWSCSALAGTQVKNCDETATLHCDNTDDTLCDMSGIYFTDGGEADGYRHQRYPSARYGVFPRSHNYFPAYQITQGTLGPQYLVTSWDGSNRTIVFVVPDTLSVERLELQIEHLDYQSTLFYYFGAAWSEAYKIDVLLNKTTVYSRHKKGRAHVHDWVMLGWRHYYSTNRQAFYDRLPVIGGTFDVTRHLDTTSDNPVNTITIQQPLRSSVRVTFRFTLGCCVNPQIKYAVTQCE